MKQHRNGPALPTGALFVCALLVAGLSWADNGSERLGEILADNHPGVVIDSIRPSPIDGVYEVVTGADVAYVTEDGRYLLQGSLIDLFEQRDLTTERQGELAHQAVAALASSMLVYEPASGDPAHTITVFTDHTCPYCQQLHADLLTMVEEDNVRVRYLMYPRQGAQSSAAETLRNVWCADDPHEAMNRAKRGESVDRRGRDCDPPLEAHYSTAQQIGVSGTPYLLLNDDGPIFAGYRPREELLEILSESGATDADDALQGE